MPTNTDWITSIEDAIKAAEKKDSAHIKALVAELEWRKGLETATQAPVETAIAPTPETAVAAPSQTA